MITPRVITSLDDVDAVSEEFKKKIGNAMTTLGNKKPCGCTGQPFTEA